MKIGGAFLTCCKFGLPRVETNEGKINNVEDCLKSRNKIYDLPRSFSEMRVNDYNPILLLLWNVTKAEKSHMHENLG